MDRKEVALGKCKLSRVKISRNCGKLGTVVAFLGYKIAAMGRGYGYRYLQKRSSQKLGDLM